MTSTQFKNDQALLKQQYIENLQYEINEMKSVLQIMKTDNWDEISFQLSLKNSQKYKSLISKFNFNDCIPQKYTIAMKKLCILAFEEGISIKQLQLKNIKNL